MTPPETIWTEPPDIFDGMGLWYDTPHPRLTEYRRADLPPTLAQALELPEIAALVAALRWHADDTSSQGDISRAALAKVKP